jgi:hypothetical protein
VSACFTPLTRSGTHRTSRAGHELGEVAAKTGVAKTSLHLYLADGALLSLITA